MKLRFSLLSFFVLLAGLDVYKRQFWGFLTQIKSFFLEDQRIFYRFFTFFTVK